MCYIIRLEYVKYSRTKISKQSLFALNILFSSIKRKSVEKIMNIVLAAIVFSKSQKNRLTTQKYTYIDQCIITCIYLI